MAAGIVAFAALSLVLSSGSSSLSNDRRYFPLKAGAVYVYEHKGSGNTRMTTTVKFGQATPDAIEFTRTRDMHSSEFPPSVQQGVVRVGDDGVTESFSGLNIFSGKTVQSSNAILRFPLKVGKSWKEISDPDLSYKVTKVDATITVPAGTFKNCVVISVRAMGKTLGETVFAPDVGMIKDVLGALKSVSGTSTK